MKKTNFVVSIAAMLGFLTLGLTGCQKKPTGTFSSASTGLFGPIEVSVQLEKGAIKAVTVDSDRETPGVGGYAIEIIPARIVEQQSTDVEVISGATITSRAIMTATKNCLELSGMKIKEEKKVAAPKPADINETTDIVIIGGGGAGLAAAVAATEAGAKVTILEKMGFLGGNAIVSGGIYNCPDPSMQDHADITSSLNPLIEQALAEKPVSELHKQIMDTVSEQFEAYKKTDKKVFDSSEWFALQTWNGGDKVADLDMLLVFAKNSYPTLKWLESMGMEFTDKINSASGSLYMRTHTSVMANGTGYIKAFTDTLAKRQDTLTILRDTEAKNLIVENGKVVGVNAVGRAGNKVTIRATKGVILTPGGFAGNVDMRMTYCQSPKWPDLSKKVITTNMPGVTGDGIRMAEEVGAHLINMDQIQLLPYANPWTGATGDITLTYSASMYINNQGQRFVCEDGRRDEMSLGIIAQPEGLMYQLFSADAVPDPAKGKTLGGLPPSYYLDNKLAGYVQAPTLAGLAEILKINPDTLQKTVDEFNTYVDGAKDPFGRITYTKKLLTGPWYAYPRKPAAHHTMGGVDIDENTHALRADGSIIEGLYCAGEVTGNLHGANRLGGNAIVDFCVFGRIAGTNAANGK